MTLTGALVLALALLVFIVAIVLSRQQKSRDDPVHRIRAETDAEIESHDIDDMLNAIDRHRRRRGNRSIEEELADELERGTWES